MTFILCCAAIGLLAVTALIAAAITITAIGVLTYTLVYAVWMLGAILRAERAVGRDRPRAIARERWGNALKGTWP